MSKRFSVFFKPENTISNQDKIQNIQVNTVNENSEEIIYHKNKFSSNNSDSNNIIAIQNIKSEDNIKLLDKEQRKIISKFYYFQEWNKKYHIDIYIKKCSKNYIYLSIRGSYNLDYKIDRENYNSAVLDVNGIKSKVEFDSDFVLLHNITDVCKKEYNISSIRGSIKNEPVSVITIEDNKKFSDINLSKKL